MVIWDYAGRVTVALSKELRYLPGPLESKAMAKEEGITFAWDVGVRDVVFECDPKTVFCA